MDVIGCPLEEDVHVRISLETEHFLKKCNHFLYFEILEFLIFDALYSERIVGFFLDEAPVRFDEELHCHFHIVSHL